MREPVNRIRDLLRRRFARAVIKLDPPVFLRPARIVRRAHDESPVRPAFANHRARRRRAQVPIPPDVHLLHPVPRRQFQNYLTRLLIKPSSVPSQHHRAPLDLAPRQRAEQRLHPVRQIVPLAEHRRLLPQSARARLLPLDRRRRHLAHRHHPSRRARASRRRRPARDRPRPECLRRRARRRRRRRRSRRRARRQRSHARRARRRSRRASTSRCAARVASRRGSAIG